MASLVGPPQLPDWQVFAEPVFGSEPEEFMRSITHIVTAAAVSPSNWASDRGCMSLRAGFIGSETLYQPTEQGLKPRRKYTI
jgi:hypothetical protein